MYSVLKVVCCKIWFQANIRTIILKISEYKLKLGKLLLVDRFFLLDNIVKLIKNIVILVLFC